MNAVPRLLAVFSLILGATTFSGAADKVALVVGNSDYPEEGLFADLENPARDARLLAHSLETAGFKVMLAENVDRGAFVAKLREFQDAIEEGGTALFYFAGHGIQFEGENYLMGTNALLERKFELGEEALKANTVLAAMTGKKPKTALVFLDCCRDAPPQSWIESGTRGLRTRGLADMQHPDVVISFAAAPDAPALDGEENSPYARSLANRILSGEELLVVLRTVANDVWSTTEQQQRPWWNGSLLHEFYFTNAKTEVAEKTKPAPEKPAQVVKAEPESPVTPAQGSEKPEGKTVPGSKPARPAGNINGVDVIFVPIGE